MGTAMKKRIRVNFIDHHSFVVSNYLRKLSAPARLVKRVKAKIRGKRAEGSLEDFTKIAL